MKAFGDWASYLRGYEIVEWSKFLILLLPNDWIAKMFISSIKFTISVAIHLDPVNGSDLFILNLKFLIFFVYFTFRIAFVWDFISETHELPWKNT